MSRVYPPVWCEKICYEDSTCKDCNFIECSSKSLNLFIPYRYRKLDFTSRPKEIDAGSIATYFGFCQRLAKFFLLLPQCTPMSAIENNFINAMTGLPARVSIQRVLLDMIDHGDPHAPTDMLHKLRLTIIMKATNSRKGKIANFKEEADFQPSQKEVDDFWKSAEGLKQRLFRNENVVFEKTHDLARCRYCFLPDCEEL